MRLLATDGSSPTNEAARTISVSGSLEEANQHAGPFDLIHDHGIWQPCHRRIAAFASRNGIPRIVSPRGMLEPWALSQRHWKKRLAWWLYQRRDLESCRFLHATADSEADGFRKLGLTVPSITIPNGTELPPVEFLRYSSSLGARQTRRALFLSRIHPKKGIELLLEGWLGCRPVGWRLSIAGSGEPAYVASLKERILNSGLQSEVELIGPVSDSEKTPVYLNADLFVLPSYSENFGLAIAEALAHGVPVITTTGCPWEDLTHHDCGWWVSPTVPAITEALRSATRTPQDRLFEMGWRGRNLVSITCDLHTIGIRMAKAYSRFLATPRRIGSSFP